MSLGAAKPRPPSTRRGTIVNAEVAARPPRNRRRPVFLMASGTSRGPGRSQGRPRRKSTRSRPAVAPEISRSAIHGPLIEVAVDVDDTGGHERSQDDKGGH